MNYFYIMAEIILQLPDFLKVQYKNNIFMYLTLCPDFPLSPPPPLSHNMVLINFCQTCDPDPFLWWKTFRNSI
jgi:hypothetical protein